jgi:hypothetical protein
MLSAIEMGTRLPSTDTRDWHSRYSGISYHGDRVKLSRPGMLKSAVELRTPETSASAVAFIRI